MSKDKAIYLSENFSGIAEAKTLSELTDKVVQAINANPNGIPRERIAEFMEAVNHAVPHLQDQPGAEAKLLTYSVIGNHDNGGAGWTACVYLASNSQNENTKKAWLKEAETKQSYQPD